MASLGRLLLRFILVPLGICAGITVAMTIVVIAQWTEFASYVASQPDVRPDQIMAVIIVTPLIMLTLMGATLLMMAPASIGIIVAEAFAVRSFLFHVGAGVIGALAGWTLVDRPGETYKFFTDPLLVAGAGFGAGLAYWLIAGWSAGFYKPVFAPAAPSSS